MAQVLTLDYGKLAQDRYEIADTLNRYAVGLDDGNADALASAFTENGVVDFTPAAKKIGLEFPVLRTREGVVNALLPLIGPLDTSHTISNLQIKIEGDQASLKAYVMSQHFLPGEGSRADCNRNALLMNRYDANLVRDGHQWRIQHLIVDNAWFEGDPSVFTAMANK